MTLAHEEPDRPPTGEWEFGREIVAPVLGETTYRYEWAVKHALWDGRRDQVINDWKTGLVKMAEHYQRDALLLHNAIGADTPVEKPEQLPDGRWRLQNGNIIQYSPETDGFFIVEKPVARMPCCWIR
ncbi:MAG: hypothetical protein ACOYCD_07860 [Kiritimatiellia bacterium]